MCAPPRQRRSHSSAAVAAVGAVAAAAPQLLQKRRSRVLTRAARVPRTLLAGASVNLADLTVFAVTGSIVKGQWDFIEASVLTPYPGLSAHLEAVKAHPLVVEHAVYL